MTVWFGGVSFVSIHHRSANRHDWFHKGSMQQCYSLLYYINVFLRTFFFFWLANISPPLEINTRCVFSLIKVRFLHSFAPPRICVRMFFSFGLRNRDQSQLNCVPTQPAFFASSFYSICSENMPKCVKKKTEIGWNRSATKMCLSVDTIPSHRSTINASNDNNNK